MHVHATMALGESLALQAGQSFDQFCSVIAFVGRLPDYVSSFRLTLVFDAAASLAALASAASLASR
jgi:hypothetical protein